MLRFEPALYKHPGFYEADGYFIGGPAPWLAAEAAAAGEALSDAVGSIAPGGAGKGCMAAASIADVKKSSAGAFVDCTYGPEVVDAYIKGEATDGGELYHTLAAAKGACSKDIRCGGVLSRSCDEDSNGTAGCTKFQTRSGMSEVGCHAGVPCASRVPKTTPSPAGIQLPWAGLSIC